MANIWNLKMNTRLGKFTREWLEAKCEATAARRKRAGIITGLIADAPLYIREELEFLERASGAAESRARALEPEVRTLPRGTHAVKGVGAAHISFRTGCETLRASFDS
tara:strand:+ start:224 stop:547 length:324 start_codon:yes stop_codon:yes gene_type:complete